jgi:hypothetical protein
VVYEDGLAALNDGDFVTASSLLEKAAVETGYTSDLINHAYTLALHHVGNKPRLADVAMRVGSSLSQHDPASAMDYFQRAIFAGLDAARVREIGQLFETWAVPRATSRSALNGHVKHVAHVVGCLSPEHPAAQYLKMLVPSLRKQGIESTIFTTEWAASWFFNPSRKPLSQSFDIDTEVKIASVDGDFAERSGRIAEALRASGLTVAFFHASLAEQITARVASMRPVPLQVSVNHDSEMDADLFEGRIHLFQSAMRGTRFSCPAEWIPRASDIEKRLHASDFFTRQSMGLESGGTVSATFGELHDVAGREYLRVLTEIMNRFPKHVHLFAGPGNVRGIRAHLHSEGVLPRVRFLGNVTDVAPLVGAIDIYLASFPQTAASPIIEAMGAGKPVVVLGSSPDSANNTGPELLGISELTARGEAGYVEIADRLLRNVKTRAQLGQAVLKRFGAEFRPELLGERYKSFLERLPHI